MSRRRLLLLALLLCAVSYVVAQDITDDTTYLNGTDFGYPSDPILNLRPPFARSLPVQVLLNGIVLTLASVLLIQLLFTAQYHWPLAPVNFALQVSAVSLLLVTSIVTIYIVLSTVTRESRTWPYMLNYLAVDVPPSFNTDWPTADMAAWLLMTATTAGLIQVTHIQFLTLLFPSKLERRLIYALLGPLAITSAVMQLLRIQTEHKEMTYAISAVQNICNAALSLLFTVSLFLWGVFVNRKNAWRMDGGTAAFGVGALTLAPMSSAIAFLYVPTKDQYTWMPPLMWSIILWQSFLGWWWWVGAGMGVGEVDELLRREEKRKHKRGMRLAKRKLQRERAETLWKGVTGAFARGGGKQQAGGEESEPSSSSPVRTRGRRLSLSSMSSQSAAPLSRIFNNSPGRQVYAWFLHWRHAHLTAARAQAVERSERMNQMYGTPSVGSSRVRSAHVAWNLGSSNVRRRDAEFRDDETVVASDSDQDLDVPEEIANPDMEKTKVDAQLKKEEEAVPHARRRNAQQVGERTEAGIQPTRQAETDRPASVWWWGPLRRWRLKDVTTY